MTFTGSKATEVLENLATDFNTYAVSYRYSENIFCTAIVIADNMEDVERAFSNYRDVIVNHVSKASVRYEVTKKNKPVCIV